MSRFKRFLHILASSYASLGAGVVYTLVSVPMALHFLPKAEFGLWAVMTQAIGYMALIDMGMTSAVARHLIDYKDHPAAGDYGSVIQTGNLVWALQGAIVFAAGYALSPVLARLLAIPDDLNHDFIVLVRWQSAIVAFGFATRIFSQIIYAYQRIDLTNYGTILGFGLNLLVLWIAFVKGTGVYSILWASGAAAVFGLLLQSAICWKCRMLPPKHAWGRPTWPRFKELFHYGKDVFLVTLGSQLTNASQTIIITRTLGLDVAAVWAVCTKLFLFSGELIWRIFNFAEPMLAEMIVRSEHDQLRRRFQDVVVVTGSMSALVAVALAVGNDPFVRVWTAGKIYWSPWNDVLLGVWLVIRSVVRCHTGLNFVTKKIGFLRFVVFGEGTVFVTLALLVSHFGGIPTILGASILCAVSVTGNYVTRRTARYFGTPLKEIIFGWLTSLVRILVFLIPLAVLTWWVSRIFPLKGRLIWDVAVLGVVGGLLWVRWGIPEELQAEAAQRLPPPYSAFVGRLFYWR
jgi:O-antigen/teichoic acid export membrane protein